MPQSATISQELKELNSSLPAAIAAAGYTVPGGYFEDLATRILQRVRAMEAVTPAEELAHLSPLLSGISKQSPYTLPADYFASLDPGIAFYEEMSPHEELAQLSPLLGGLPKKSPFTVPEGYFEQPLPVAKKDPPVVQMAARNWFKYAIAASVTAVIAVSALLWMNQRSAAPAVDRQPYAWVEKSMKKVSTEDISRFVELADETSPDVAKADKPDDIKSLLRNVSDKEIQDFLKDVPLDESEDDDILLN